MFSRLQKRIAYSTLTFASLLTTATLGFADQSNPATLQPTIEAFPEMLPDWAARRDPPPQPETLALATTFAGARQGFQLAPVTPDEIAAADARAFAQYGRIRPGPFRMGFVRSVGAQPRRIPGDCEAAQARGDGTMVWLLSIQSPGAFEVRVHLTKVDLGRDRMLVYSLTDTGPVIRGPYYKQGPEHNGELWPASVPGSQVFIEVTGPDIPQAEVAEIVHCDRDAMHPHGQPLGGGDPLNPEPCELDVMCFSTPPINVAARQAVGRMRFIHDGNMAVCTGTLIADSDTETYMPYFLTANHCIDETVNLNTLEVYWLFQKTPCALGDCPNDSCFSDTPPQDAVSVGATLLTTSGATVGNDATFLRLKGGLPGGIGFAGYTNNEEIGVACIHHPNGSWKRVFFGQYESTSTSCGFECGCFTPANYAFYSDTNGIVEPGSSGSAMFTTSGQVIGQLYGGCALCPDAFDCWHTGDWCLQFGEWGQTYADASYWLHLGGTLWVDASNLTSPWNGLQSDPYLTATQAYNAAWDSVQIKFVAGNYPQNLTMNKHLYLKAASGIARIGQ